MFQRSVCIFLSVVIALTTVACSSQRVVVRPNTGQVVEKVEVGDEVRVRAKGRDYFLEVTEVGSNYLRGIDPDTNKRYRIPFDKIEVMYYEQFDVGETATAVGAATIVLYALAILVVGAAINAAFDGFACIFSFGADCDDKSR